MVELNDAQRTMTCDLEDIGLLQEKYDEMGKGEAAMKDIQSCILSGAYFTWY